MALLGFAFHGMAGIDARLATIAQARDAARNELVVQRRALDTPHDCPKADPADKPVRLVVEDRDY